MTKKIPPHLPAPVCNINDHKKWLRLKLILASAAFGLFAGVSGAAIMLGWIWPGYGGGDIWAVSEQNRFAISKIQLEEKIAKEIRDRLFTVYARPSAFQGNAYLRKSDKLGDGIAISSDGWLAMYLSDYNGQYKNWRVLSADGSIYGLEKAIFDKYSGIVYLKLSNISTGGQNTNQLKVVSFSDSVQPFDEIFIYQNGNWIRNNLSYFVYNLGAAHLDTAPNLLFGLVTGLTSGTVAINNQGRVVGFITKQGMLLPNIYLTRIMSELLNRQVISYPSLGVDGWFSREQPIVVNNETIDGFAVNRVWSAKSPLKKGDIILEVNGQSINKEDFLWFNNRNEIVKLEVQRNIKIIELESKIFGAF